MGPLGLCVSLPRKTPGSGERMLHNAGHTARSVHSGDLALLYFARRRKVAQTGLLQHHDQSLYPTRHSPRRQLTAVKMVSKKVRRCPPPRRLGGRPATSGRSADNLNSRRRSPTP